MPRRTTSTCNHTDCENQNSLHRVYEYGDAREPEYVLCDTHYSDAIRDNSISLCHTCNVTLDTPEGSETDGNYIRTHLGNIYCNECSCENLHYCNQCGCQIEAHLHSIHRDGTRYLCRDCHLNRRVNCCGCNGRFRQDEISRVGRSNLCTTCVDQQTRHCSGCLNRRLNTQFSGNNEVCTECMRQREWALRSFDVLNVDTDETKSGRCFGVEIETSRCPDHQTVRPHTVFGCKVDGSVDGMEFISPILKGDQGLSEIRNLCDRGRDLGWEVDSACGLHVHLDMRDLSVPQCFKVAFGYTATYDFWSQFITNSRKSNYYCSPHLFSVSSFLQFCEGGTRGQNFEDWIYSYADQRYTWCNWSAYCRHKTVELRNHPATLDGDDIANWVKAHTRFIDKLSSMEPQDIINELNGYSVYDQFNVISEWWDDDDLTEFYRSKAALCGKPIQRETVVMS